MNVSIIKKPSDSAFLKFIPSFEDVALNAEDYPHDYVTQYRTYFDPKDGPPFSLCNYIELMKVMVQYEPKSILEIGVDASPIQRFHTSTKAILHHKNDDAVYVGVDIENKHHLNNEYEHIFTLQANSQEHERIEAFLKEKQIEQIDLLFIDGNHSIDLFLNDWFFTHLLSPNGIVAFHDVNQHPGPREFFEAISEQYFEKKKLCPDDLGIAVCKRLL